VNGPKHWLEEHMHPFVYDCELEVEVCWPYVKVFCTLKPISPSFKAGPAFTFHFIEKPTLAASDQVTCWEFFFVMVVLHPQCSVGYWQQAVKSSSHEFSILASPTGSMAMISKLVWLQMQERDTSLVVMQCWFLPSLGL